MHALLDEIKKYWTPTLDQGNWAHEIAMDIIALWSCGPAYVGAFLDEVERDNLDLFQISTVHPPYCVRILAILCACPSLKLDAHAGALQALSASLSKHYPNKLAQLAPEELVAAAVDAGFAVCKALEIRDILVKAVRDLHRKPHTNLASHFCWKPGVSATKLMRRATRNGKERLLRPSPQISLLHRNTSNLI